MKRFQFFVLFFLILCTTGSSNMIHFSEIKTTVSTKLKGGSLGFVQPLAGCDELGRILPDYEEVGGIKDERNVGIFYFLWQGDNHSKISEQHWDLSKMIPNNPEILEDSDHPLWGSTEKGRFYFWGEPIYGYYRGDDYWVHLKNMQLLTDAQIDFLVIDATNTLIYEEQSDALMRAIQTLQKQGKNPPRMVYYTNTESGKTMQKIYDQFYREGAAHRYPSTWYYLEGKPLIIGRMHEAIGADYSLFFTFRQSQWPNEPMQENGWPWIDFSRPQQVYKNLRNEREIVNVSVSQHPNHVAGMGGAAFYGNNDNWGRSYRKGQPGNPQKDILFGYNFQEQWDYAIKQEVPFIFITGWNEWVAGRWGSTDGNPKHSYFCDQANPEFSRDIEPTMTSQLKDNYYMQMVANIRKYKGMNPVPIAHEEISINKWSDWKNVKTVYTDYAGDIVIRDHPGAVLKPPIHYTNHTGRNDIVKLKVTKDQTTIYFFAETTMPLDYSNEEQSMRLFINIDRNFSTGWMGYDFRINAQKYLQKYIDGKWETILQIESKSKKNMLTYSIPLNVLCNDNKKLSFEFKWSDNMQKEDPMDWYINGDVAPEGRFNYLFKTM